MVIIVSAGESIQTAVNNANAGDTILVRDGVFNESVNIPAGRNALRIIGEGPGDTILDGAGLAGASGFTITGSSFVTIANFTVQNFELNGVRVETDDNVVRNNEVTLSGETGIVVAGDRNLLRDNSVHDNGDDGILVNGERNYVVGNRCANNADDGIEVGPDGPRTVVVDNEVCGNGDEGLIVSGNESWVIKNRAYENTNDGLDIQALDVLVYGNTSTKNGQSGLEVDGTGLMIARNKLNRNGTDGITVRFSDETPVEEGLRRSLVYANEVSYNAGDGFHGNPDVVNTLFLKNDVDENGDDGIDLDGGDFNRVLFNDIDDNDGPGIDVDEDSDSNIIDDNLVDTNHGSGIRLDSDADLNAVRANRLRGNTPFDILAEPPAVTDNTFDLNDCNNSDPAGICD